MSTTVERARQICANIEHIIYDNADDPHHCGALTAEEMAQSFCVPMNGNRDDMLDTAYDEFAQAELDAIKGAVMPDIAEGGNRRTTMNDAFTSTNLDLLTRYYAQCVIEFTLRKTDQRTTPAHNVVDDVEYTLADAPAQADIVRMCCAVVRATAASVVARVHETRYASARNTMRTVFSMTKALLYRDCPRGASVEINAQNVEDRSQEVTLKLIDPPLTRTSVAGGDTEVDTLLASRNAWLCGAWSMFVSMTHGIEKASDLPIAEKPEDMSAREWYQLRGRQVHPQNVAKSAAYILRLMQNYENIENVKPSDVSAIDVVNTNLSFVGQLHLALISYFSHRAVRSVERAETLFFPSRIDGAWAFDDFERLIWFWPEWRGGLDRPRTTKHNAQSTRPTAAVFREDARHVHQLRNTRSTIVPLPEQYWRPHDAQDTAATVREDSNLALACARMCYSYGVAQSIVADPGVSDEESDKYVNTVSVEADAVSREIEKHVRQLRELVGKQEAPMFHERAMVDAHINDWPGDTTWTLSSPNAPDNSAYAHMYMASDGTVAVDSSVQKSRQFDMCRRMDVLQTDILVAQKALRTVEALLHRTFDTARTSYAADVLSTSRSERVDRVSDLSANPPIDENVDDGRTPMVSVPTTTQQVSAEKTDANDAPVDASSSSESRQQLRQSVSTTSNFPPDASSTN